jgi:hypothetical protein
MRPDRGYAAWHGDIAFSYLGTRTTLARSQPRSKKERRTMVEKGRDILHRLKELTGLTAQQHERLEAIQADLRKMQEWK